MMKMYSQITAFFMAAALALTGCASGAPGAESVASYFIRAVRNSFEMEYPEPRVISSAAEAEAYLTELEAWFDMREAREALSGCDEAFFENSCLVAVMLEEPNGGVRHRVDAAEYKAGRLRIGITRIPPEGMSTSVMTQWHIFIEQPRFGETPAITLDITTEKSHKAEPESAPRAGTDDLFDKPKGEHQ